MDAAIAGDCLRLKIKNNLFRKFIDCHSKILGPFKNLDLGFILELTDKKLIKIQFFLSNFSLLISDINVYYKLLLDVQFKILNNFENYFKFFKDN